MGPVLDHPIDYISHAVGGAIVVEIAAPESYLTTAALTLAVGYGKESLDKNVDHVDALSWVVGGLMYKAFKVNVTSESGALVIHKSWEF